MTIQRVLAEAARGNVRAMIQAGDFYSEKMEENGGRHRAEYLQSALQWYEKAAQTGDAYALEMTSAEYAIFAEVSMEIGAYEDALREWTQVYRYTLPLVQYPGYPDEKKQEISIRILRSVYKAAYCNYLLKRYDAALGIFEGIPPEPYTKEMMLKGICMFEVAEQIEDFEMAYDDALRDFDFTETFDCIWNAEDDLEEMVMAKGYMYLSIYHRMGMAGVSKNLGEAYSLLSMVAEEVSGDMAWNVIQGELNHYKRKLFGGYQYIE